MIDKNMEVKKISEIAYVTDYVASGSFAKLKENVEYRYEPDYAILVRLTDYKSNWNGDFVYIPKHSYEFLHNSNLSPGDIVISNVGAYAGAVFTVPDLGRPMSLGPNAVVVKPYNDDRKYLYYYFTSYYGQGMIKTIISGSAQPKFNKTDFRKLEIPIPPLPIQQKIASVLCAYDTLITNNSRRFQILEEMAQLIYREWFVHYRFPGHENVKMVDSGTEFGEIPEGWCTKPISDVVEILGGGTPSIKVEEYWEFGDINWYTPSDLTKAGTLFMDESSRKITKLGLKKSSAKLFPSGSVMMTSRATLGVTAINTTPACTNQGFITCVPSDEISNYEIYYWIKENIEKMISVASGATFKEITKSVFRNMPIVIPPLPIHNLFVQNVSPIFSLILNLQRKNENLHKTRNLLLPKLISGEIDVSELEIEIA